MNRIPTILITLSIAAACTGCCNNKATPVTKEIGLMPAMESGYEKGVSAMYAATCDNILYIAGGCNFPTTPAAQGGSKRYYKGIYAAPINDSLKWQAIGELPESSAYGAQAQQGNQWYIAGGMNESGATRGAYRITIGKDSIITDTLPQLPYAIDNAAGCISGNTFFVAGGNADGRASALILALNINNTSSGWKIIADMRTPRVQPVCAATGNNLYVWGGFAPGDSCSAKVHTDGMCYNIESGECRQLAAIETDGVELTLSGGTAVTADNGTIYATGGVNKDIFLDAITGQYRLIEKKKYMLQPVEWYKFNSKMLMFNPGTEVWQILCNEQSFARAGALLIEHKNSLIYIGGELKPGIRTPKIHTTPINQHSSH